VTKNAKIAKKTKIFRVNFLHFFFFGPKRRSNWKFLKFFENPTGLQATKMQKRMGITPDFQKSFFFFYH
jgi:hypothetical protein